jgi:serine/threonine-protein phosphatase PGAM5
VATVCVAPEAESSPHTSRHGQSITPNMAAMRAAGQNGAFPIETRAAMNRCLIVLCSLVLLLSAGGSALAADAQQPAERTIVLVRHGSYEPDPNIDEKIGPHLSPLGSAQAHLAGARLAGMPGRFDGMYVSPMQRARDTAAIIGESFPGRHFEVVDDLAECVPPTWRTEVTKDYSSKEQADCKAALDRDFARFFKPAFGRPQRDLLVCHGDVIRYLVTRALRVDTKAWLEMSVGNASITVIRVQPDGRMKVISVGDVGHIPPNLQSGATGDPERSLAVPALQ